MLPFNLIAPGVFFLMKYTDNYSEHPFKGVMNDASIQSIMRNIEIDLKDMLVGTDLPKRTTPVLRAFL